MDAKKKLNYLSLIAFYPILSTLVMTLVWQIEQVYHTPMIGGYYFKWVYLYSEFNPNWLSGAYLPYTRVLYFIYIFGYLALVVLAFLTCALRKGKAICLWCIVGLWLADCIWVVADMIIVEVQWQLFILLAEHLLFIFGAVVCSLWYLKIKKENPALFEIKQRRKKVYKKRFQ